MLFFIKNSKIREKNRGKTSRYWLESFIRLRTDRPSPIFTRFDTHELSPILEALEVKPRSFSDDMVIKVVEGLLYYDQDKCVKLCRELCVINKNSFWIQYSFCQQELMNASSYTTDNLCFFVVVKLQDLGVCLNKEFISTSSINRAISSSLSTMLM